MHTSENNTVYYLEENHNQIRISCYKSKNQALLNKATRRNWTQKKVMRNVIIIVGIFIAISCFAFIRAYADNHVQLNNIDHYHESVFDLSEFNLNEVDLLTVEVEKGDSLWSIANQHAPSNVSMKSYIHHLMLDNDLNQPIIHAGQILTLPQL